MKRQQRKKRAMKGMAAALAVTMSGGVPAGQAETKTQITKERPVVAKSLNEIGKLHIGEAAYLYRNKG